MGRAWGYRTDPSGLVQLGVRWYWPELGRFIEQDPIGDGANWYAYAGNNPITGIDPEGAAGVWVGGLHLGDDKPWLVFDSGSLDQLGMSAGATAGGVITGLTGGLWRPNWNSPCDQYAGFSRGAGMVGGGALAMAGGMVAGDAIAGRLAAAADRMVTVSRWGREGIEAGDWVMKGPANWRNYVLSGKWQPGLTNQFAPFSSGAAYEVPGPSLTWPGGFWGPFKGTIGQRMYMP